MKKYDLRTWIFLALCCDLGLFAKRIIAPFANILTDSLHIPGGIGTSFSLMFLVIAAMLVEQFGCATIMGAVQSGLALGLGMTGSMGALAPIGYIMPGIAIDVIVYLTRKGKLQPTERMMLANSLAAVCASISANFIVFHLRGAVLLLYVCVAATSGAVCGLMGERLLRRLKPVIGKELNRKVATLEVRHEKVWSCSMDHNRPGGGDCLGSGDTLDYPRFRTRGRFAGRGRRPDEGSGVG